MGETRPKLEIVNYGGPEQVFIYVGGKMVAQTYTNDNADSRDRVRLLIDAAREIGQALGADVAEADEPTRQPYRYFIAYAVFLRGWRGWFIGGRQIVGSRWFDLDQDIDGPDDTRRLAEIIAADIPGRVIVTITGITYIDGPC